MTNYAPWWAKIIAGLGTMAVLFWLMPLLELFELFMYVVIIPLLFLYAFGLVSHGTLEAVQKVVPNIRADLMSRVEKAKDQIKKEEREAVEA